MEQLPEGQIVVQEATLECHTTRALSRLAPEVDTIVSTARSIEYCFQSVDSNAPADELRLAAVRIRVVLRQLASAVSEAIGSADQLALCADLELGLELNAKLSVWPPPDRSAVLAKRREQRVGLAPRFARKPETQAGGALL